MIDPPGNYSVACNSHTVRVCDHDRPFQKTTLFNPGCPGHLTVAIQPEKARINWIVERLVPSGNDRSYARTNWTLADFEFAFTTNQCGVTYFDAGHVRDGVKFAGSSIERNAQIARADSFRGC